MSQAEMADIRSQLLEVVSITSSPAPSPAPAVATVHPVPAVNAGGPPMRESSGKGSDASDTTGAVGRCEDGTQMLSPFAQAATGLAPIKAEPVTAGKRRSPDDGPAERALEPAAKRVTPKAVVAEERKNAAVSGTQRPFDEDSMEPGELKV